MKSILEKALVHLLNEEAEKAQELMHQFVVERARSIHESLRESDEADFEEIDAQLEEEFFTEADLEDAEAAEQLEDDLGDDDAGFGEVEGEVVADTEAEGEAGFGDFADAVEGEGEGEVEGEGEGEVDLDTKLDAIEGEIKNLQAEFDKIMAELDGDEDFGDEGDLAVADEGEVEGEGDDEFDDITESMVDDLKKVSVPNEDGKGANGEKIGTKTETPVAKGAKPRVLASKNTVGHTGFDRESAPTKKDGPDRGRKYDNNRVKATAGNSAVPAGGNKKAEISKPVVGNTKSVIPGKKK